MLLLMLLLLLLLLLLLWLSSGVSHICTFLDQRREMINETIPIQFQSLLICFIFIPEKISVAKLIRHKRNLKNNSFIHSLK